MKSSVFITSDTQDLHFTQTLNPTTSLTSQFSKLPSASTFLFCGKTDLYQKILEYSQNFDFLAIKPLVITGFNTLDLEDGTLTELQDDYTRFAQNDEQFIRDKLHQMDEIFNLQSQAYNKGKQSSKTSVQEKQTKIDNNLKNKQSVNNKANNPQPNPSFTIKIFEILTFHSTTTSKTHFLLSSHPTDTTAIINFIQSHYCFQENEMRNYETFLKNDSVAFKSMRIYDQMHEKPTNFMQKLIRNSVFQIFIEGVESQIVKNKISSLREVRVDVVEEVFSLDRASKGLLLSGQFTHCRVVEGVVIFEKKQVRREFQLLEQSVQMICEIQKGGVESQIEDEFLNSLLVRTNQLILKLNQRLTHSEFKLQELKEKHDVAYGKQLNLAVKVQTGPFCDNYMKILQSQADLSEKLSSQLAVQEFYRLEEFNFQQNLVEYCSVKNNQKQKQYDNHILGNKVNMIRKNYENSIKQVPKIQVQKQDCKNNIAFLTRRIQELKIIIQDKEESVVYNREICGIYNQNVVQVRNLINQYSSLIRNYNFETYMSNQDKGKYFQQVCWRNSIYGINKSILTDEEEVKKFLKHVKKSDNLFEQLKSQATSMEVIGSVM